MESCKKLRDLVYGFIYLDEQECAIIDHPVFQRLRRIKQLSLTDMVYPGASHTRFEHSIGVMQMATNMYDSVIAKRRRFLRKELSLNQAAIQKYRKTIRLAALLHDVGHAPFSHAGEELMLLLPKKHSRYEEGREKRYVHEDYSIALIKTIFREIIEEHRVSVKYGIKAEDVTALLGDTTARAKATDLLWRELISGQIDADRADYLIRDSLHLGVSYGIYDKDRLISCMTAGKTDTGAIVLAIDEGGWHIAESLVLARYQMFTQVYYHKVRRIYDYHITCAIKEILKNSARSDGCYPSPDDIKEYVQFDDWTIYSALKKGLGGTHGGIILERRHYKRIDETSLNPTKSELAKMEKLCKKYKDKEFYLDYKASTPWYKLDKDILIYTDKKKMQPLSEKSSIVKSMVEGSGMQRFYAKR